MGRVTTPDLPVTSSSMASSISGTGVRAAGDGQGGVPESGRRSHSCGWVSVQPRSTPCPRPEAVSLRSGNLGYIYIYIYALKAQSP